MVFRDPGSTRYAGSQQSLQEIRAWWDFSCSSLGSPAPVRTSVDGAAAEISRDPGGTKCGGFQLLWVLGLMALLEPFANLWQLIPRGPPLGWSFLLLEQQVPGASLALGSLYCSVCQALKGSLTRVLLYCCTRHLKDHPLWGPHWSAASAGEERKAK